MPLSSLPPSLPCSGFPTHSSPTSAATDSLGARFAQVSSTREAADSSSGSCGSSAQRYSPYVSFVFYFTWTIDSHHACVSLRMTSLRSASAALGTNAIFSLPSKRSLGSFSACLLSTRSCCSCTVQLKASLEVVDVARRGEASSATSPSLLALVSQVECK